MSLPGFTVAELLADTTPAPRPLIDPWLDVQGLGMIHAAPGVGKSMLSLAIALAVAGGGRLLGWEVPTPQPVLYIDAEMTRHRLRERVRDLLLSIDGQDEALAIKQLRIVSKLDYAADRGPFPEVGDGFGDGADEMAAWVEEQQAGLVVLDNLSQLAAMQDENATSEARKLTQFTSRLRSLGAAVIEVHHDSKGSQGGPNAFRGNSGLNDPLDVRIGLGKRMHPAGSGVAFNLDFHKQRHNTEAGSDRLSVRLDKARCGSRWMVEGDEGQPSGKAANDVDRLLETSAAGQYDTQKALGEALGWPGPKVTRERDKAVRLGRITLDGFRRLMRSAEEVATDDF